MIFELSAVIAAVVAKLTTSADDFVWLTKLLSKESRRVKLAIEGVYLLVLIGIVLLAFIVNKLGVSAFVWMNFDEIYYSITASIILILVAIFYLRIQEDVEVKVGDNRLLRAKMFRAFTISSSGSIDELVAFIILFSTNKMQFFPLMIGTIIAGIIVIAVAEGLNKFEFIIKALEYIKVWILIVILGMVSLLYSIYQIMEL